MSATPLNEILLMDERELQEKLDEFDNSEIDSISSYLNVYCQIKFTYEKWRKKVLKAVERNTAVQEEYFSKARQWQKNLEKMTAFVLAVPDEELKRASKRYYHLLERSGIDESLKDIFFGTAKEIISINESGTNALKEASGGSYRVIYGE